MKHSFLKKISFLMMMFIIMPAYAKDIPDPCEGLLALVNRPGITGSACSVPNKEMVVEGGYQYLNLTGGAYGYLTPQAIIRFGLPDNNEFLISAPSYYHQNVAPSAGWSVTSLSFKHEIGYNAQWVGAVEGILALPTGSDAYGSRSVGGTVNGIVTYTVDPIVSISGMLGVSSISVQYLQNGARFTSVNPDIFVSWQLNPETQVFLELYSQTRTGPDEGMGFLTDGGIFYLLTPRVTVDAEVGQRLTGQWGFQNYVSGGLGLLFG